MMLCGGSTNTEADDVILEVPGAATDTLSGASLASAPGAATEAVSGVSSIAAADAAQAELDDEDTNAAAHAAAAEKVGEDKAAPPKKIMRVEYESLLTCPSAAVEIGLIVESAQRSNQDNGIGGFLTYNETDMTVKQWFEGEESKVQQLWKNIQADARHRIDESTVKISKPEEMKSGVWSYGMSMVTQDKFKSILAETMKAKDLAAEQENYV